MGVGGGGGRERRKGRRREERGNDVVVLDITPRHARPFHQQSYWLAAHSNSAILITCLAFHAKLSNYFRFSRPGSLVHLVVQRGEHGFHEE